MEALKIKDIKIANRSIKTGLLPRLLNNTIGIQPSSDSLSIVADTDTEVIFIFNRKIEPREKPVIRCCLYEPIFQVSHDLDDITITTSTQSEYGSIRLKIPEELAGAVLEVNFCMKKVFATIDLYEDNSGLTVSKRIDVRSKDQQAPYIIDACLVQHDDIRFGVSSTPYNGPLGLNEACFIHVHTRGMYGQMAEFEYSEFDNQVPPTVVQKQYRHRVNNNVLVYFFTPKLVSSTNQMSVIVRSGNANAGGAQISLSIVYDSSIPVNSQNTIQAIQARGATAQASAPTTISYNSDSHCWLNFRPPIDYDGGFGFSWLRNGDLALATAYGMNDPCNDHDFVLIMGRHTTDRTHSHVVQDGNKTSNFFDVDSAMLDKHKLEYSKITMFGFSKRLYHIPFMTIRKGMKAKLEIFIETTAELSEIIFEFDNPRVLNEKYIEIESTSPLKNIAVGRTHSSITITCNKEFSKGVILKAMAISKTDNTPQLCGAVRLLANDTTHQRKIKVVFFNVQTNINSKKGKKGLTTRNPPEVDYLKKYLGQSLVKVDVVIKDLNFIDRKTKKTAPDYIACCCSTVGSAIVDVDINKLDVLKTCLEGKIKIDYGNDYDHYFKIFFLPDICQGLNGYSLGEKFTVCFPGCTKETPVHELLHSLGLPHTFNGNTSTAKYVYQYRMTDNIMDYSHLINVKRQSLFHWQWKAININL